MSLFIDTPIQYLKGVGPKLGDMLRKRSIETVGDLLEWYPRGYQDQRACRSISSLEVDDNVSLTAQILKVNAINMGRSHRKMYDIVITDGTGRISCKFFRSPYKGYFERFQAHQKVRVTGKVTNYRNVKQFQHPTIEPVSEEEDLDNKIIPLYTETEGISPGKLRKMLDQAIDGLIDNPKEPESWKNYSDDKYKKPLGVPDPLPLWVREKYNLIHRSKALKLIHKPSDGDTNDELLNFSSPAQKRVIFDEFFNLELVLALNKAKVQSEESSVIKGKGGLKKKLIASLPFELTKAQQKALVEIEEDISRPYPMHRMVQGDVGSGKTLVAFLSGAIAVEAGFQFAMMAPTEILAEQHFKNAQALFASHGVRVGLLTGSMRAKEKREIYAALENGEIQFCVGTHALIQDEVVFNNLGLVVIDEQHRFGVSQRGKLKRKGKSPHFLVMTATPIPRTLAMTVYGDLDVTLIKEMPKGRMPIVTRRVFPTKRQKVFGFMEDQIKKGRQAYVVYPLVAESDKIELKNAIDEFEKLKLNHPSLRFGLLHGKMPSQEKEEVMKQFRDKNYDVLVATTVIEVGVDVPNANLMIIEHAERFGLSQLHQLRGRVGRGLHKSYCVLMLGYASSEESKYRTEVLENTTDGFKVAEADLEIRGPGQFLGTKQAGLTGFKMANLVRDIEILQLARKAAFELIEKDQRLNDPAHRALAELVKKKSEHYVG